MTQRTYDVPDVSCDHCVSSIEGSVGPLEGVESVTVDLASRTVRVVGGDDVEIRAAIDDAGYDVAGVTTG
jgi:copper chaperone